MKACWLLLGFLLVSCEVEERVPDPALVSAIRVSTECFDGQAEDCNETNAEGATSWGFIMKDDCADVDDSTPSLAFATAVADCDLASCAIAHNTWSAQALGEPTIPAGTYCVTVAVDVDKSGAFDDGDAICEREKFFSGNGPFDIEIDDCETHAE